MGAVADELLCRPVVAQRPLGERADQEFEQAGIDAGRPLTSLLVAGSAVTSLLTLYAVSRVWARAFWRRATTAMPDENEREQLGASADGAGGAGIAPPCPAKMSPAKSN